MSDHRAMMLSPVTDYEWPVTYLYRIQAPWGESQHELTMNVPTLVGDLEATSRFGLSLWSIAVARATSMVVRMNMVEVYAWRGGGVQFVAPPMPIFGGAIGLPSPRERTPAVHLHTGKGDALGVRRFPVIGAPSAWTHDGLVTNDGLQELETTFQVLVMGAHSPYIGGPLEWLLAYRNVDTGRYTPPIDLGFRRVEYVRVLHHTLRAPVPSASFGGE
jgi:hypothetical protein